MRRAAGTAAREPGRDAGRARAQTAASLAFALLLGCGSGAVAANTDGRLEPLPVAPDSVTVSGISAGGYMAVQFHVAQSSLVHGAGVLAAGPYGCAEGSVTHALGTCMKGDGDLDSDRLVRLTRTLANDGRIDPVSELADDRVWLYHGGADPVVGKGVVDALQRYYETLVGPKNLERVELAGAGHTFPAQGDGLHACGASEPPFIGNCGIDAARKMLEHLYGRFDPTEAPVAPGDLRTFDQRPYATAAEAAGLGPQGWVYVPAACEGAGAAGRCRLHVALHGCKQGASYVEDVFVRKSGYLAAADAGHVVVLFPQAAPSFKPLNPNGCWDWWGYTGDDYGTRRGPQIVAIRTMVDDLLGVRARQSKPRDKD
jgi:poly(3-hydroxybutyrate) depolymerase